MQETTNAWIVCSPRPRVGVTTVARLLGDYFLHNRRAFEGFDTDPHESRFAPRFPREVRVANVEAVKDQIALFDRLLDNDGVPRIVDLWQRAWKPFLTTVHEIGYVEEAARVGVTPIFLLIVDDSAACLDSVNGLLEQWPTLNLVLVRNEGAAPPGEDWQDALARYPVLPTFEIPPLDPVVARAMERSDTSLSRLLIAPPSDMSIVVRTALRHWLMRVFAQFESFELRQAMQGGGLG